eukprot:2630424-Pyramimonas_sp.AAC.1
MRTSKASYSFSARTCHGFCATCTRGARAKAPPNPKTTTTTLWTRIARGPPGGAPLGCGHW